MKKILNVWLAILLISQIAHAGNISKSQYDVLVENLESKVKLKYQREYDPKMQFFTATDPQGYTAKINLDYELFIDAAISVLEETPADLSKRSEPFYQTTYAFFLYGLLLGILIL